MTMPTATKGRIVHLIVPSIDNNGDDVAPAIVVRAWGLPAAPQDIATPADNEMGHNPLPGVERQTINVRVLLDQSGVGGIEAMPIPWATSVLLFQNRPTAEQLAELAPHNPKGEWTVAFWPPLV